MRIVSLATLTAVSAALGFSASANASTLLFSDSFLAPNNPDTNNLNYNLVAREGGTLGTGGLITYGKSSRPNPNAQVGNSTGGIDSGNYLLNAFGTSSGPNQNFNQGPGPLTISFDVDGNERNADGSGTGYLNGDRTDWTALNLSNSATPTYDQVNGAGNSFGILFRGNGDFQTFTGGTELGTGNAYANDGLLHHINAVISDLTGTGSGFTGSGTLITLYADGAATPFASYSSADPSNPIPVFTNNQVSFQSDAIGAVDNLAVSVVPEPASLGLLGVGALGLLARRRRA